MWARPKQLKLRGIIGMNRRNIRYIGRYNSRRLYPLVDDKLKTKLLAEKHGITTPALIGTVSTQFGVKALGRMIAGHPGFVIKPAKGSGGKGILVIEQVDGESFIKPSGARLSIEDLHRHVSNILSGLYSLGGTPDVAMIEGLINFDEKLSEYTYEGVPDIRVIIFRGYPVMAMMRLSTAASDGKANLHQGAVGVGLDIATGTAVRGVQFDRTRRDHPDTGHELASLRIPDWSNLLELAAGCYEMTGLGYLGTDMVIDRNRGPMLLELNARPGLAIQMANGEGLRARLDLVEKQPEGVGVRERVAFSQRHFARHGELKELPEPVLAEASLST
ncbi:alpha-L-glutamate ligase-like protein [Billgrantia desiderata]|uniref:Alpha-L-glutamate ligase-like protein n=1 Tax=Billgrantia desiderata TaxID=52021 RepID=A0AAW4YSU4_9GAMM|nr:alpha-L-glutamate ligase-like protein [Halomonas desiderata]MCE8011372.1 alpha-L-glutamate ligase-like protein [Halomonas desiderata]MCE8027240.1 alpha-L-glutamate ligase-like protein [Halomonas desiderata]MCE8040907.1 alpha-L-glutamate ligase-like protein [Halomonas desiderata]MCE8045482.1 alpha-L-glutamate ligase-like protein [Halomonas desiderata]MCE8050883.1 alpha-L-glutamate ligase-like protein [Halomonas desiderata]